MAESSSSKRSKLENRDIISSLPDHLLHRILYFLPINQAVPTSLVLSKRWTPLGLSMPFLYFNDSSFSSLNSFTQFVDALLFLSDSKPITSFCLKCKNRLFKVPSIRINLWLKTVISRKVACLALVFASSYRHIDVSACVLHSRTIRILKLERVMVNARSPVHLPSLKVLHLVQVYFPSLESAANILSGCSFLEELLVLQPWHVSWGDLIVPNMGRFQHLVSAKVPALHISVLAALSNVKFLRFFEGWLMIQDSTFPNIRAIPVFSNLTELEMPFLGIYDASKFVECLQRFPKLEILNIHMIVPGSGRRSIYEAIPDVPHCVASNLKKFSLGGYKGSECEFELVTFIMKNASDLRIISICCFDEQNADSKLQMLTRLSSCPRGSVNCMLLFK